MNQKQLFLATFTKHSKDQGEMCMPCAHRKIIVVADSFVAAAEVARANSAEGETLGLSEISDAVIFA